MSNYNLVGILVEPPYSVTHEQGHTFVRKGGFPKGVYKNAVSIDLPDADKAIYARLIREQTGGHPAAISIRQLVDDGQRHTVHGIRHYVAYFSFKISTYETKQTPLPKGVGKKIYSKLHRSNQKWRNHKNSTKQ